jgi:hypothetical protein
MLRKGVKVWGLVVIVVIFMSLCAVMASVERVALKTL